MRASAPGKLFLLGEYAVLEGAPGIIAAVDRRAYGEYCEAPNPSPVVQEVTLAAQKRGYPAKNVVIRTEQFYLDGQKLGLGSSAAVAVVTAALQTQKNDQETLMIALEGHKNAQGGGSGLDVMASFYGGVIGARRGHGVEFLGNTPPPLSFAVYFSGHSASTPDRVKKVLSCPAWLTEYAPKLGLLAEEGLGAWKQQDGQAWLKIARAYCQGLNQLFIAAGLEEIQDYCLAHRGDDQPIATKPSGAGGGDVNLAWFWGGVDSFHAWAAAQGWALLALQVGAEGLRFEPDLANAEKVPT